MDKKEFVLVISLDGSPLYLSFKDKSYNNPKLVVCDIPIEMALQFLEKQQDLYFTRHITIPRLVKEYLIAYQESEQEDKKMWEVVKSVESCVEDIIRQQRIERKKRGEI